MNTAGGAAAGAADQDAVVVEVTVPVARRLAFHAFTWGLGGWWPREYTWSREVLVSIGMEPHAGGLCHETGPFGFTCHWGRVLAWELPRRLVLAWQIGPTRAPEPDPARASVVEVTFTAIGDRTLVRLTHLGFERHGEGADEYRRGMASPFGWPYILAHYVDQAAKGASTPATPADG